MQTFRVHALFHASFEGLGAIKGWLSRQSCHLSESHLDAGEALPTIDSFDWLIIMGGPMSIHDETEFPWLVGEKKFIAEAIQAGKVVLGFCLGAQLIASVKGGQVFRNREKEIGWFPVHLKMEDEPIHAKPNTWVKNIFPDTLMTFHWHGETFSLPAGAIPLAYSAACDLQGFVLSDRIVALQFHPEMEAEGIHTLVHHCDSDRKQGSYVQKGDEIFGRGEYFNVNQFFLEELLQGLRNKI